jgi:hypothetical protein
MKWNIKSYNELKILHRYHWIFFENREVFLLAYIGSNASATILIISEYNNKVYNFEMNERRVYDPMIEFKSFDHILASDTYINHLPENYSDIKGESYRKNILLLKKELSELLNKHPKIEAFNLIRNIDGVRI